MLLFGPLTLAQGKRCRQLCVTRHFIFHLVLISGLTLDLLCGRGGLFRFRVIARGLHHNATAMVFYVKISFSITTTKIIITHTLSLFTSLFKMFSPVLVSLNSDRLIKWGFAGQPLRLMDRGDNIFQFEAPHSHPTPRVNGW